MLLFLVLLWLLIRALRWNETRSVPKLCDKSSPYRLFDDALYYRTKVPCLDLACPLPWPAASDPDPFPSVFVLP